MTSSFTASNIPASNLPASDFPASYFPIDLSSIRGHVGAQKARVNGVYGVNDEIVITSKLVKSIWFFCSVSNFALSKVNFIELVSKT